MVPSNGLQHLEQFADVIAGWQLCVTMSFTTPLQWLNRHGELSEGATCPETAPQEFAIWVPLIDLIGHLPPMASMFGQIPGDGGTVLPFLKEFRSIVEGDMPAGQQDVHIRALCDRYPEYSTVAEDDLAQRWFCLKLSSTRGIGWKTAQHLYQAGILTAEAWTALDEQDRRAVLRQKLKAS